MADNVLIKFQTDINELRKDLKDVQGKLSAVEKGGDKAGKNISKGMKKAATDSKALSNQMNTLGTRIAAAFSIVAVVRWSKELLKAYDIQAKAERALLTSLNGRVSVQRNLIQQAQTLQKTTLFGDEETIRAQALLAAFTKEEETIKRLTPLIQDFAAAKQIDLATAADLVAKTIGSTTNALGRYGIEVKGAQGSTERLNSLAEGLSRTFGGQAQAAAEAGTGGLKQLENAYGDLKEALGAVLNEGFNPVTAALTEYVQYITYGIESNNEFLKTIYDIQRAGGPSYWERLTAAMKETVKEGGYTGNVFSFLKGTIDNFDKALLKSEKKLIVSKSLLVEYTKVAGDLSDEQIKLATSAAEFLLQTGRIEELDTEVIKNLKERGILEEELTKILAKRIPFVNEEVKGTKTQIGAYEMLTKKIEELNKEIENQAAKGSVAKAKVDEYRAAVEKLSKANFILSQALYGTEDGFVAQSRGIEKAKEELKKYANTRQEKELTDQEKYEQEQLRLAIDYGQRRAEYLDQQFKDDIEREAERARKIKELRETAAQRTYSAINDIQNAFLQGDINTANERRDAEIKAATESYEEKIRLAGENANLRTQLENELAGNIASINEKADDKVKKLQAQQAQNEKNFALFSAIIQTALAVSKAFGTYGPTPPGFVAAAIAAAEGAAQIAVISNQPIPKFKHGGRVKDHGMLKGASHERGGIMVEAEGDEYFMPTKQSRKYFPVLEAMRKDNIGIGDAWTLAALAGGQQKQSIQKYEPFNDRRLTKRADVTNMLLYKLNDNIKQMMTSTRRYNV